MALPKFLGCDLSIPTYSWSAGTNASYPVSNLKTGFPDMKSRSNATTAGQSFVVDMGSAVACNALIIEGHNFAAVLADTVSLEADDNSGFTSPTVIVASITVASADELVLETFDSATYRYWRVVYDAAGPLGAAPEIGNIYLGTTLNFEKPQEFNSFTDMPSHETSKSRSIGGHLRTSQNYGAVRKSIASFRLQSNAFIALYKTFLETVKNDGMPFYYIDEDGIPHLVNMEKGFNPYEVFRYDLNNITELPMESTMADT